MAKPIKNLPVLPIERVYLDPPVSAASRAPVPEARRRRLPALSRRSANRSA